MKTHAGWFALALALLALVLTPGYAAAAELSASDGDGQSTHTFKREIREGGITEVKQNFSEPTLEGEVCAEGSCDCITCECTGTFECCLGGCLGCWDVLDDAGICGAV